MACDPVEAALREWVLTERRLGLGHYGVPCRAPADRAASPRPGAPRRSSEPPARVSGPGPGRPTRSPASGAAPTDRLPAPEPIRGESAQFQLPRGDPDLPPMCDDSLPAAERNGRLTLLNEQFVKGCQRCGLHAERKQTVFGVGRVDAELVFVGEGPGAEEDAQGLPFVGRAGELLNRMIAAMTLKREQVYICNVVKCRPPGNRTPSDHEMQTCAPFLFRQLAILRPKVLVALGRPAAQTLLATQTPISRLRGEFHEFPPPALAHLGLPPCPLMPTFHPAYLLRSPDEKAKAWHDLKKVMALLGIPVPQ